jgi:hypothetical protein
MKAWTYFYHCTPCGKGGAGVCSTQPPDQVTCVGCLAALDVTTSEIEGHPSYGPFPSTVGTTTL